VTVAARLGLAALLAGAASAPPAVAAEDVAAFYRGKTVTIIVGSDSGGGYDLNARALSRHMARHLAGEPTIIVQNKPGASSLAAANYVYEGRRRTGVSSPPCSVRCRSSSCSARPACISI